MSAILLRFEKYKYPFLLLLIWIISAVIVNPVGEFPLNDDWAFSYPIKSFMESGKLKFVNWAPMTLIGQVLYGILFSEVFGYSFTTLRCGILISGIVGSLVTFSLIRQLGAKEEVSFLGAMIIGFNPVYFSLSFTFMTDVFFCSSFIIALLFFYKELEKRKTSTYIVATVFSIVAVSIRQPGLVIPFAFALTACLKEKGLKNILYAFLPFLITLTLLLFYESYLRYQIGYPADYPNKNSEFLSAIINHPFSSFIGQVVVIIKTLLCIGLFFLPLSVILYYNINFSLVNKYKFYLIAFCYCFLLHLILHLKGPVYPFSQADIVNENGIGPKYFYDTIYKGYISYDFKKIFWKIISYLSLFSSYIILYFLYSQFRNRLREGFISNNPFLIFCSILLLLYVPLMTMLHFFDRYLLPAFVLLLLIILSCKPSFKKGKIVSSFFLLVMVIFSISGTTTYLNWSRARWQAAEYLTNTLRISPNKIDGGFEFNGYYTYSSKYAKNESLPWWWVYDNLYLISFSQVKGYNVIKTFSYSDKLNLKNERVFVSKRQK